jgi:molybdopterin converting factor small subunit
MARVFIPAQLRHLTEGDAEIEADGATVRELVEALEQRFPGFAARVCEADDIAPALQLSIDGTFSRRGLAARVTPHSEVHFLPVFGGG